MSPDSDYAKPPPTFDALVRDVLSARVPRDDESVSPSCRR